MADIMKKTYRLTRTAQNVTDTEDLKERMQITGRIMSITFRLYGEMVSTGGGAVTAFSREAPWPLISLLRFAGHYVPLSKTRTIMDAPPDELFFPSAFMNGALPDTLIVSAGAAATDPIRGILPNFWTDPGTNFGGTTWVDSRLYTDLTLSVQWASNAQLAATNLSLVQGLTLEIQIEELVGDDIGAADEPHFEPTVIHKTHASTSQDTKLTNDSVIGHDGQLIVACFRQHDDSAVGNAQRTDGIIRRMTLEQGGKNIINNADWSSLIRATVRDYPLAYLAAPPVGVIALGMDPPIASRKGAIAILRDTETAVPPDITGIVATTNDALESVMIIAEPNASMDELLVAAGAV